MEKNLKKYICVCIYMCICVCVCVCVCVYTWTTLLYTWNWHIVTILQFIIIYNILYLYVCVYMNFSILQFINIYIVFICMCVYMNFNQFILQFINNYIWYIVFICVCVYMNFSPISIGSHWNVANLGLASLSLYFK